LMAHPEIPHGPIRVGFTPDEEVGAGTTYFDVARFGAKYAYTMDGGRRGELETESFSADAMTFTFRGLNTHPGYAKDRMVNAIKVAADFINRLPRLELSPETTDDYDGYVHPYVVNASVETTTVKLLIRDFGTAGLHAKESFLAQLAGETVSDWAGASVDSKVEESYRNMKRSSPHIRWSSNTRGRQSGRAGSRSTSGRFAAALTAAGCRSWVCRRRTFLPASRTSIRAWSGSPFRTWRRPSRSS